MSCVFISRIPSFGIHFPPLKDPVSQVRIFTMSSISPAERRIQRDLAKITNEPIIGTGIEVLDKDIRTWYLNILGTGNYEGIPLRIIFQFTEKYPIEPPNVYFLNKIMMKNGKSVDVNQKGWTSICVDIFGNYYNQHSDWHSSTGGHRGWTPACTVSTIIAGMPYVISEYFSNSPEDIKKTGESFLSLKCSETGHDGSDPSKWVPKIFNGKIEKSLEEMDIS